MAKLRVAVLYGGISAEREVSLVTGQAIFSNLDRKYYIPTLVELAPSRTFWLVKNEVRQPFVFYKEATKKFDVIFIALHGTLGEDGGVQGMLEVLGVPYTGSKVLASALAMNKVLAAAVYAHFDIPTPDFVHCNKAGWKKNKTSIVKRVLADIGLPVVVKPVDQGSAVGVAIVKKKADLIPVIVKTFKKFDWLMMQQYIPGDEATCGVLDKNGVAFALPPTRIIPELGEFYDYTSKYAAGGSRHVCPADFSMKTNQEIQKLALLAHQALQCDGMSRTDVRITKEGKMFVLETNTIPGMTPTSLLPEAAKAAGITFREMLNLIIRSALKRF